MNNVFYKFGIIGNPLSHSVSPALQMAALKSVNQNGNYEKFEIEQNEIEKQIKYFVENDFSGFNITIPYKQEVIKYLDSIDEIAQKIGAVNTVKITNDKKLFGYNTDILGFLESIKDTKIQTAKIIGCGGAALAVVFALEILGCTNLSVFAKNLDKAKDFIQNIQDKTTIKLEAKLLSDLRDLSDTDILINATPLGTKGINESISPINKSLFQTAKNCMIVYDLVYNPQETLFLKDAKSYNLKCINGLDMLVFQGAKAFEIWTELSPNTINMKTAAIQELNNYLG